jgi:hypothetical protein
MMSALMADLISGRVSPETGAAACNAGGKMLKVVEMQYKYGPRPAVARERELLLVPESTGA